MLYPYPCKASSPSLHTRTISYELYYIPPAVLFDTQTHLNSRFHAGSTSYNALTNPSQFCTPIFCFSETHTYGCGLPPNFRPSHHTPYSGVSSVHYRLLPIFSTIALIPYASSRLLSNTLTTLAHPHSTPPILLRTSSLVCHTVQLTYLNIERHGVAQLLTLRTHPTHGRLALPFVSEYLFQLPQQSLFTPPPPLDPH